MDLFADTLLDAASQGYGDDFNSDSLFCEDEAMVEALRRDVVRFSSAKNDAMQTSMLQALIDKEGKLRSWNDFKSIAYGIGNVHKDAWLKAEYELAVSSAQMASKWVKIVKKAELFPYLQYDAVLDDRTTFTCRDFDAVTLPVDHWFWGTYYPPNHWGCRSTVRQLTDGTPTDLNSVSLPDIPQMFQTNLAQSGLLYPPNHPYYEAK